MKCFIFILFCISVTCEESNDVDLQGTLRIDDHNNQADYEIINKLLEIIRTVKSSLKPDRATRRTNENTFYAIVKYGLKTVLKLPDHELKKIPRLLKSELAKQFKLNAAMNQHESNNEKYNVRDVLEHLLRKFKENDFDSNEKTILKFFSNLYKTEYGNTIVQCIRKLRRHKRHSTQPTDTLQVIVKDMVQIFKNNFYMNTGDEVKKPLSELIKSFAETDEIQSPKRPTHKTDKRQRKKHKTRQRAKVENIANRREITSTTRSGLQTIWYEEIGKIQNERSQRKNKKKHSKSPLNKRSYKNLDLLAPRRFRIKGNGLNISNSEDVGHMNAVMNLTLMNATFVRNNDPYQKVNTSNRTKALQKNMTLDYVLKQTSELKRSIHNLSEYVKDMKDNMRCAGSYCNHSESSSFAVSHERDLEWSNSDKIIGRIVLKNSTEIDDDDSNDSHEITI